MTFTTTVWNDNATLGYSNLVNFSDSINPVYNNYHVHNETRTRLDPYIRESYDYSDPIEGSTCMDYHTNGTCVNMRYWIQETANEQNFTSRVAPYSLPYSIKVSRNVTADSDTGFTTE